MLTSQQQSINKLADEYSRLAESQQNAQIQAAKALAQLPSAIADSAAQAKAANEQMADATQQMIDTILPVLTQITLRLEDLERMNAQESRTQLGAIKEVREEAQNARQTDREEARREGKKAFFFNVALTLISVLAGWLLSYLLPFPK